MHRSRTYLVADRGVDDPLFRDDHLRNLAGAQAASRLAMAHLDGRDVGSRAQRDVLGAGSGTNPGGPAELTPKARG